MNYDEKDLYYNTTPILLGLVLPAQDICSPVREGYLSMSDEKKKLTVLLSGASFASVDNGWFELGCEALRAKGINRAIGGEAIADVANRMSRGDLYSREELDEVDVFVIMQVHNRDVYAPNELKRTITNMPCLLPVGTMRPLLIM